MALTRRRALALMPGMAVAAFGRQSHAQPNSPECIALAPQSKSNQQAAIMRPGRYCASVDFRQRSESGAGHSWPPFDHSLIKVYGSDVTIDLAGKTLHTEAVSSGVLAYTGGNRGLADSEHRDFGLETRRIVISNGTIDLRGRGTGVRLIDWWLLQNIDEKVPPEVASGYKATAFVLQNLTIKTDHNAVELEGDGNVIRHCTIESSGNAAIAMAGPNGLIADNRILLKNPWIPTDLAGLSTVDPSLLWRVPEARRVTRAVILLRQASGTVISGNEVRLEGESDSRLSICIRDGSRNIRIENNQFAGITEPVTLLEGSTAKSIHNVLVT